MINVHCFSVAQVTKSFPEGAPQREEYNSDLDFEGACLRYAEEWRAAYRCQDRCSGAAQYDCPQCGTL